MPERIAHAIARHGVFEMSRVAGQHPTWSTRPPVIGTELISGSNLAHIGRGSDALAEPRVLLQLCLPSSFGISAEVGYVRGIAHVHYQGSPRGAGGKDERLVPVGAVDCECVGHVGTERVVNISERKPTAILGRSVGQPFADLRGHPGGSAIGSDYHLRVNFEFTVTGVVANTHGAPFAPHHLFHLTFLSDLGTRLSSRVDQPQILLIPRDAQSVVDTAKRPEALADLHVTVGEREVAGPRRAELEYLAQRAHALKFLHAVGHEDVRREGVGGKACLVQQQHPSARSGEWHGRGGASAAGPDDNDVDGFNGLTGTAGSDQRGLQYRRISLFTSWTSDGPVAIARGGDTGAHVEGIPRIRDSFHDWWTPDAVYVDAVAADPDDRDIEAAGLLDNLHGRARQERADLVRWLLSRGFNVDQIRGEFSPMLLPANRMIGDDGTLVSPQEISDSSGVNLELLRRLHSAVGLVQSDDPEARLLSRADAESVLGAARLVEIGLDPAQVTLIGRLLMDGLTNVAVMMRQAALHAALHPGATELELAQAFEVLAHDAEPILGPMVGDLLRLALRHSFETEAINVFERTTGTLPGARQVAVAFADLVGFTRLGEQIPPEDLGLVALRLADLARTVVKLPVHFVKTIGDAVMLVCSDPHKLLVTILDLVDAAAADDFPRLRAGLAFGPAVNRAGDWYGSPVNLASRVTSAAPAGTVRVTGTARDVIGDPGDIQWTSAQARRLKGIRGGVRLYGARRIPADASPAQ